MSKRFYKFTDGTRTIFRATGNGIGYKYGTVGGYSGGYVGFSNIGINYRAKVFPTTEITQAEFKALTTLKALRVKAAGGDNQRQSSPQDAWVWNSQLEPTDASDDALDDPNYVGSRHHY
jgi:hypothetical protein